MPQPSIPQGMRDFDATTVYKRQYIIQILKNIFQSYGFEPIETPAMENLETLTGKYGEEGDKLIFKILNNGLNNPAKSAQTAAGWTAILEGKNNSNITERALRYDLTIPFARYVAMYQNQLVFPFKRYQIQPVWRADRPQKGRYREFYQCDADIVGSDGLLNELNLLQLYAQAFEALKLKVTIKINDRRILTALATSCSSEKALIAITTAIDKLEKIGWEKVAQELEQKGLSKTAIDAVKNYVEIEGSNEAKLTKINALVGALSEGEKGIETLAFLTKNFQGNEYTRLSIDFALARGLDYYTGIIFEVKALEVPMGSIGGGGRYADLVGSFGLKKLSGVGISFGIDRIYDVMESLNIFPFYLSQSVQVLILNTQENALNKNLKILATLRQQSISADLYPDAIKWDKQLKYADKKNIPFVIIAGDEEIKNKSFILKNLNTGIQKNILLESFVANPTSIFD